ncbi:hypothetical protein ACN28S_36680 [Cystobacter fuscus]
MTVGTRILNLQLYISFLNLFVLILAVVVVKERQARAAAQQAEQRAGFSPLPPSPCRPRSTTRRASPRCRGCACSRWRTGACSTSSRTTRFGARVARIGIHPS